ncbi:FxSxx-COOH system tetratricopeptide repeat protein [Saccharothrix coeruleofusca]|uniref:Cytochrome c n=1 Tax=Saccharothrix coeruleofusca TaxID=33919 RepID=A0A918AVV9_9PSEU|nr:FxSxx-COOH system tetratricopeptide repeat protein [Saccharothrix coeruleofusca]GGP84412.1 cytochrome c [Saccharothrix coeruleofusca]
MTASHNGHPVREVVLQHLDPPGGHRGEALRTADLTLAEVRDSLWLAGRALLPDAQAPAPRPADSPTPAEPPDERPPPAPPSDAPPDPSPDPASDSAPVAERDRPPPRSPALEKWVPGPVTMVPAGGARSRDGGPVARSAWPTVPGLPDRGAISRALRPVSCSAPSPRASALDEVATAVRAAEDGLWIPVMRAEPWRRYEVALVVDTSLTGSIWQQTVEEFQTLLRRQGAFRDVRTYLLDSSGTDAAALALRGEGGARHHWRHLAEPTGTRIVLVLTDATEPAWRSGAAGHVLHAWGQRMPVAVVQVLAQRLWSWSGLSARRMRLSAPAAGAPNRLLRVAAGRQAPHLVPVPVLGLSAEWMAGWARLITAPGAEWVETTATLVGPQGEAPSVDHGGDEHLSAADRVRRFRTYASADGFQLAGLLAATPLSLRLMKLVQQVLLPGSDTTSLAEVMLSGLMRRLPDSPGTPDAVAYEFDDGVREALLATCRRADTARVARVLDEHAGPHIAALRNFGAALDAPDHTEEPEVSPDNAPYLRVQAAVLRALGGPYARRSKRIYRSLLSHGRLPASQFRASQFPGGQLAVGQRLDATSPPVRPEGRDPTSKANREAPVKIIDAQQVPAVKTGAPPEGEDDVATPGTSTTPGASPAFSQRRPTSNQPQVWGQVPLPNPVFVGRVELLEQLRVRLTEPGTTAVLPEALHGMGGVGKSQTVVEYIHRHASEYEVVWWIPAEHPAQITASLVELARRLGVATAGSADTAVPAVLEALRKGEPYKRWILVFDNADRPQDVRQFFPTGTGHVVVTSRNSEWGGFARSVEVDLFTREESIELLHRRAGDLEQEEANALAEALGDLPLAVEQAAAWRAQTGMQVSEYLSLLEQNRTELLEAGTSSADQLPVAAAWNVPLNRLAEDHPAALQLLQVCAFFGPEPISQKLFRGVTDVPVPDALSDALSDPIKLSRAVREISRYSLAKLDHRNNALQLHRLVQTVLKNRLDPDEQRTMRHAVHILLLKGDPADPDTPVNWPRYAELLPHALVSRAVECQDKWVRQLIQNLVRYLLSSGDYGGARDLAEQAVRSWREHLGEKDLDTLQMSRRYAIAMRRLGHNEESARLNEKTFRLFQEVVGEEHEAVIDMLDTVAADRRSQGRFAEELELQEKVYSRARDLLGEDEPDTLRYAHNLASCYRLMGQYGRALDLDQENLRRRTAVLGTSHPQTFSSRNAVAMDMREVGQYGQAAGEQEYVLAAAAEVFEPDHPLIIGATRNLSVALRKAGHHERAKELSEKCLLLYRRRHGDNHPDTATAMMNLATDLRHLGDLDGSRDRARRSHEVLRAVQGQKHPYTIIAALNLAVTLRLRGEVAQALEIDRQAHDDLLEVFDADHPYTLVAATNLASDLAALGDLKAACDLDRDTLERTTRVLGVEHPSTLAVALNLALDLDGLGEKTEAAVLHAATVANFRKVLGEEHPATIAAGQSARANCDTDTMQL